MGIIGSTIFAVFKIMIIIIMIGWIIFVVWWAFKKMFRAIRLRIKKVDPEILSWCEEQNTAGRTASQVRKELLLAGNKKKEVDELIYIFRKVKQLKGGVNDGKNKSRP